MNATIQTLMTRRSIRAYLPRQIEPDALETILQAGLYAPSGMGRQSTVMVVVQDRATIDALSRMNAAVMGSTNDEFYGAPTLVIVLADRALTKSPMRDGSLVMGNLMNAAHALGIGSCWINRAQEVFATDAGKAYLKQWGLDGDYVGVGNCILGYPDGDAPAPKPRRAGRVIRA